MKNGEESRNLVFQIVSFNYFPKSEYINDCNAILENGEVIRVDPFVGRAFKYENAEQLLNQWWIANGHWHENVENNVPLTFLARENNFKLFQKYSSEPKG